MKYNYFESKNKAVEANNIFNAQDYSDAIKRKIIEFRKNKKNEKE